MALGNALALSVATPDIRTMENFQNAQANAQNLRAAKQQQEAAAFEQMASLGLGVMDGDPNGAIDPEKLSQALSLLGDSPIAAKVKENPELLRTITKGSISVLQNARDGERFEMEKKKFELDLAKAQEPPAPPAPVEVSAGATMWDPTTKQPLYTAPTADKTKAPDIVTIYKGGKEQKGYMGAVDEAHPDGFYPVGDTKAETPRPEFTVSQATAAGYADRMQQADAILSDPKLAKVQTDVIEAGKGVLPGGNFLTSPEFKQADQAQRDFINAILRRESGAVISESEFANARKQYFPQPGDDDVTLKQKAANRRNAIKGVARAAGPAYQLPDTTNYLDNPDAMGEAPATSGSEAGAGPGEVTDWTDYFD